MNIFMQSRCYCSPLRFSLLINKILSCSCFSPPYLSLYSLPLSYSLSLSPSLFLSPSISKGQMFPAVTVVLHWYSALNLAKSQAAVSASSNHTHQSDTEHTERGRKGLEE